MVSRFSKIPSNEAFPKLLMGVGGKFLNLYVLYTTLLMSGIKNFRDNYKQTFIRLVSPKIVYTSIDHNPAFFELKNLYDKPCYISDQIGMSKTFGTYRQDNFYGKLKKYAQKTNKTLKTMSYSRTRRRL